MKISLIYLPFDIFCDNNYSPATPNPLHTAIQKYILIYMLWFNSTLGLNFIFFCFWLIIIHYHTQKSTYLGSMWYCLSEKAEMPTSDVESGNSLFYFPPPPNCQQPHYTHYPHHPPPTLPPNWPSHLKELCEVLYEVVALLSQSMAI